MKELSHRSRLRYLFWFWAALWVGRGLTKTWLQSYSRSVQFLMEICIIIALVVIMRWLLIRFWDEIVYDDGDALVITKGSKRTIRIPFSTIRKVTFRPHTDENIDLELDPPSALGRRFRFNVEHDASRSMHNAIADDLHRRSLCCKEGDDHKSHEK